MGSAASALTLTLTLTSDENPMEEAKVLEMIGEYGKSSGFAIRVMESDYHMITEYNTYIKTETDPDDCIPLYCEKPSDLLQRMKVVYEHAVVEEHKPLEQCRFAEVITYKFKECSSSEEQAAFNKSVMAVVVASERPVLAAKVFDNSKSFGGTEADSKNEKEAAALLRGEGGKGEEEGNQNPYLAKPSISNDYESKTLRKVGQWCKYLGGSGCYVYFHTLTKDVLSIRPDDYEENETDISMAAAAEEEKDPANGIQRVKLIDMPAEVDSLIVDLIRTPLIIDQSEQQVVKTFYTYKALLEDVSCLSIPFGKSGIKQADIMERCRAKLVTAMKTGGTMVLYLGGVGIEHCDMKNKLCKKDCFPKEVFQEGGKKMLGPEYDPRYKKIFREPDLEHGEAIAREGFRFIVVTSLDPYEYEDKLKDCLPLSYLTPLYIES